MQTPATHLRWSILLLIASAGAPAPSRAADTHLAFVGTYTGKKSEGIYVFPFDAKTGKAGAPTLAAKVSSPSFLALHPGGKLLYAVSESGAVGMVSAFSVDSRSGKLTLLNDASAGGAGPCHIAVDHAGKNVLVANYGDGTASALPIAADGRLTGFRTTVVHAGSSANPNRQAGPHAHCIALDAHDRYAFVADLGLDRVMVYRYFPETGGLVFKDYLGAPVKPGSGPRHFAFHPGGGFAYVISEIACTMTAFAYDAAKGELREIQTLTTLPEPLREGFSTAEVEVHPSGKFLYGSNRGHDSIVVYAIDPAKGTLTPVENEPTRGKTPRSFGIDPTGSWLLAENQDSDTIVVFKIDAATGRLDATGEVIQAPSPVCLKFLSVP